MLPMQCFAGTLHSVANIYVFSTRFADKLLYSNYSSSARLGFMFKSIIYLVGALSLHFTDFSHPDRFYSTFLPFIDVLFLIFLCWQLLFFMTLNSSFSDGDHYSFYDLIADVYDLRYDIQDQGIFKALFCLALSLFDVICFFVAMFYYYGMVIDMVQL